MPLSQMKDFTFKHSDQQDALYSQYTAQQIKALFDSRGDELRTALNSLISTLNSKDGASNIGTNAIQDVDGSTIQAMLKSVRDKLKSKVKNSSGADYVNATLIDGLAGETVQSILVSLKLLVDNHKKSSDHDDRYFTKNQLQSITSGNSGADLIKATPLNPNSGDTVQKQLAWMLSQIAASAIGSIPDGSISEPKLNAVLANKINTSLSNVGSMSTLITKDKSSAVNAINEIKQEVTDHKADNVRHITSAERAAWNTSEKNAIEYAKGFGLGTAPPIINNCNLSTNGETGFYNCSGTTLNMPPGVTSGGTLIHIAKSTRPTQIFQSYTNNLTFTRTYTPSGWTDWVQLATTKQDEWVNAVLQNGWTNFSSYTTGYSLDQFGIVRLRGYITGGTKDAGILLFTLPAAFRPKQGFYAIVNSGSNTFATLFISTTGTVSLQGASTGTYLSLSNISFSTE
ncbi:hypothetical protein KHA93_11600 [Bacillus sp. FJAT-49732]|uniref:Uncharacterized protein n=1 Tax=Lederbergia citrisecunda TaxID=2833583 RepID=A0A942TMG4_9BACI|nr:pyocin knob domain-containing protein [Lederbergia citrisecunda]MBS4200275.1 hypothetical protein [Lederbergia citrisecunda]